MKAGFWNVGDCDFASDPEQTTLEAPVFWRPEAVPTMVMLQAAPEAFAGALALDFAKWPDAVTRAAHDGLHAILDIHKSRPIRLVIQAGIPAGAPLAAVAPLDDDTPTRLATIQRLGHSLRLSGPHLERDPITSVRRGRLVFMLRALDGRITGATHRAIAEILFRLPAMPAREW